MAQVRRWVLARPGSRRPGVGGGYGEPPALVVAVAARAVEGKANAAVVEAVAEALGLPRRTVRVAAGAASRRKLIAVEVPAERVPGLELVWDRLIAGPPVGKARGRGGGG